MVSVLELESLSPDGMYLIEVGFGIDCFCVYTDDSGLRISFTAKTLTSLVKEVKKWV